MIIHLCNKIKSFRLYAVTPGDYFSSVGMLVTQPDVTNLFRDNMQCCKLFCMDQFWSVNGTHIRAGFTNEVLLDQHVRARAWQCSRNPGHPFEGERKVPTYPEGNFLFFVGDWWAILPLLFVITMSFLCSSSGAALFMLSIYTGALVEQSCSRISFFHHVVPRLENNLTADG